MSSTCELSTERLRLVPCIDAHLDGLHAINSDVEVMRYLGGRTETRAQTQLMIERVKERWVRLGYSWWSFIERQSGEIVGAGEVQNLRRGESEPEPDCPLEIGWRVRRDRWGQGIAPEAARAMAAFAFERVGADVLYAVCEPDNAASIAVMVKLGMTPRGLECWYARTLMTYEMTLQQWQIGRTRACA